MMTRAHALLVGYMLACFPTVSSGFALHGLSRNRCYESGPFSGWAQGADGEWEWEEDDPLQQDGAATTVLDTNRNEHTASSATPQLPSGKLRPKQSLGQNYLRDGNTVAKMIRAFHKDATRNEGQSLDHILELGPGAGALTNTLVEKYGTDTLQCIEIDERAIDILKDRYPDLEVPVSYTHLTLPTKA